MARIRLSDSGVALWANGHVAAVVTCGWAVDFTRPLLARGLSLKSRLDYYANKLECRETRKLRHESCVAATFSQN